MRAVHVVGGGPAGVMAAFAAMRHHCLRPCPLLASLVPGRFVFHATRPSGLKLGA